MKNRRSAVPIHISIVFVYALVLTLVVVFHVYTDSSLKPQIVPASAGPVQDDPGLPIAAGTEVLIVYTISIPEYHLTIPSNFNRFAPGHDELLPHLEKAITGMKKGEAKRVDLGSDEVFGPYDESKQVEISKDRLPAEAQPGMILATEDGTPCMVVDLSEDMATIDFNHPLAGKRVVIDVRILDVEVPPADELQVQQEDSVTGALPRV